jgi:hypothetical protein
MSSEETDPELILRDQARNSNSEPHHDNVYAKSHPKRPQTNAQDGNQKNAV